LKAVVLWRFTERDLISRTFSFGQQLLYTSSGKPSKSDEYDFSDQTFGDFLDLWTPAADYQPEVNYHLSGSITTEQNRSDSKIKLK
jgi:hypothetical protein